jgi:hypothetical protein
MKFERSDICMINNVSEAEIIAEFNKFGEENDDFVVLSKNDMNYIQAAPGDFEGEGLVLEYQDGSLDRHFSASDTNISKEQILSVFLAYLKGEDSWKDKFIWEKTILEEDDLA